MQHLPAKFHAILFPNPTLLPAGKHKNSYKIACFSGGLFLLVFATLLAAQTYTGPTPAKPDLPYLLHADTLIPTESQEARQSNTKDGITYTLAGAASPVRTPLASPAFVLQSDKLEAEKLQLYLLRSAGTHREITFSRKKKPPESYTFEVKSLGNHLYRLEVNESLPRGSIPSRRVIPTKPSASPCIETPDARKGFQQQAQPEIP